MAGGKWMDTFMDKLAHRLNAQEMIKANASAEAAETTRLKEQNAMYEELLQKVQDTSVQSETNATKIEQSADKLEQGVSKVDASAGKVEQSASRVDASAGKVEQSASRVDESAVKVEQGAARVEQSAVKVEQSAERAQQNAARVEELVTAAISKIEEMQAGSQNTEELNALLEELKAVQNEKFEALTDHVHKENVKVYRNVQAAVVEELAKTVDLLGKQQASTSKKVTVVMILSIITLLTSAAGVTLQILMYLNII